MSADKPSRRITIADIARMYEEGERFATITAYDYPTARIVDEAGIPLILVGDSLGMVMLGYDTTVRVNIDEMLHHTRAVVRGTKSALVVADMPYLSYHVSIEESVRNAGRFIQAGAHAVKVEGAKPGRLRTIEAILEAEVPVMGHIGLTPQSVNALGGFKLQGKNAADARRLIEEAKDLERVGCFSIVLEAVPSELAAIITEQLTIPTIGIGAGPACDGQVLVFHDVLGLYDGHTPKFARRYADLGTEMQEAFTRYLDDVRSGRFPDEVKESFHMASNDELKRLYASQDDEGVVVEMPKK